MDRIENESSGLFCPGTADVFVRGKAFQDLETTGEVVSGDEVDQVGSELVVAVIVIAVDGRLFDRAVHPLDLPIGPWVIGLGQAMLDAVGSADLIEAVDPVSSGPAITVFWQVSELNTVIGQHRMQPVWHCRDQGFQETHGGRTVRLLVQGDEGEFRGPIDRDEQVELSLCCAQLGDVDVEIADRVGFEFSLGGTLVLDLREARDAVPLQAAMQR